MKEELYYIAIGDNEIVIAVGEKAGLSLEDDYTVAGPVNTYGVVRNLFRKVYQNDKKSVVT